MKMQRFAHGVYKYSALPISSGDSGEENSTVTMEDQTILQNKSVDMGHIGTAALSDDEYSEEREYVKAPWWSYIWDYDPLRTHQERKFVQKLDISLLTILSLGYFIKALDSTNISNAYVSGMKEDLNMNGNQLNLIDVAWTSGYVIGQLPSQLILTKVRPSIWIPSCELVWTVLTFSLAATTTSNQVIAIRFFIGLSESIFYPAAHYLIGSWYKPSELSKRACVFHASSAAAAMFSGYLQAAVYTGLNGTLGKAGWQWLFIMDGVISIPIAVAGFFLYPDFPETTRAFYLNSEDRILGVKRMRDIGREPRYKLGWSIIKRVFGRWHVYSLTVLYIIFINSSPSTSVNPFSLWLKANGYSVNLINIIPTGQSAVQLVATVGFAILSDFLRKRAIVMSISTFFGLLSSIILAIWFVPVGAVWFAFFITRLAVPYGPLSMSWANEICTGDAEERALVLGIMNASGYAFNAWVPLLTYPATDAPTFRKGFIFSCGAFVAQFAITGVTAWQQRREVRRKMQLAETTGTSIQSDPVILEA